MRVRPLTLISLLLLGSVIPTLAASHKRHVVSTKGVRHTTKRFLSQRSIDDQRASEIQQALIKAGYLTGEPSGHWDADSQAAMQKLQSDNGWQTKLVPDSRALIKLGLGPSGNAPPAPAASNSAGNASATAQTFAGVESANTFAAAR